MSAEPPKLDPQKNRQAEMPFLDHLEELRWRIIKGLAGLVGGAVLAFIFSDWILNNILLGPARADFFMYQLFGLDAIDLTLQSRKLPGQFFTYLGTLVIFGSVLGSPVFFYQLWAFIEPAFEDNEAKSSRFVVFYISLLFLIGVGFGYLILTPFALQFFTGFQISNLVRNDFDINEYFASISMWTLSCGIIFQLPMISYFLSKIGLLTPEFLKKYRKQAIIGCFVLGAFVTPPDPVSQTLVALPLLGLYQISIIVSRIAEKKRNKEIWGKDKAPN